MITKNVIKVVGYVQPIMELDLEAGTYIPYGYEMLSRGKVRGRTYGPASLAQLYDWSEIDHAVLQFMTACRCKLCMLEGNTRKFFVNLSPRTMMHPKTFGLWLEMLTQVTERHPGRVIVEINELADPALIVPTLDRLRDAGIQLALDDYGVGVDRSAQLISADWDYCKIDLQAYDGMKGEVLRDIRNCQDLGIKVILEKVEDLADIPSYIAAGVRHFQGFALGMPVSPGKLHDPLFDACCSDTPVPVRAAS